MDSSSNTAEQKTRTVHVEDNTKPVITLSGADVINIAQDAIYTDAGATALDNFDGDLTSSIVSGGIVNTSIT